jgi:hypothetical protein
MKLKVGQIYYDKESRKYFVVHHFNSKRICLIIDFATEWMQASPNNTHDTKRIKELIKKDQLRLVEDEPTVAKLLLKEAFRVLSI